MPVAPVRTQAQAPTDPARPSAAAAAHFRPDIEGLRGLAVLLVVLFHAWPASMAGGFIGVDVFFVISGFLITGLLYRELGRTGRISFSAFYVRRVRRLFPAAALVLVVTFLLSAWVLSPLALPRVSGDGVAAALSVANIRFALASGDYFSAVATPSPFLHFWSLSVEEQFYLVWPALLLVIYRFGGARVVAMAVVTIAVLSLVLAVTLTEVAPSWAFYSLPSRTWQLAVGGLLAIVAVSRFRAPAVSAALAVVGWVGVVGVLLAGFVYDDVLAYPGVWALLPTLAAVAIIAGGDRAAGPGLILRTRPFRFLGRISYALYLWHWPLLILPAVAYGGELPWPARLALVVLAVSLATLSTLLLEEPIRRGSKLVAGGRVLRQAAGPILAVALAVVVGVSATRWVTSQAIAEFEGGVSAAAADGGDDVGAPRDVDGDVLIESFDDPPEPPATAAPSLKVEPSAKPTRKPRKTPTPTPLPTPRAKRAPDPARTPKPTPSYRLPRDVRPSLFKAQDDIEVLKKNGCLHREALTWPQSCVYGKASSKFSVALVGDSHASHWFPALRRVADDRGWRLETYVKVSCPFTDILVRNLEKKKKYKECLAFNANVVQQLKASQPDLVITAVSRWQHPIDDAYASARAQGEGMARMLEQVPGRKVVIADVPYPGQDVPECLAKNIKDIRPCAAPARNRNAGGSPARERQAAQSSGGVLLKFYDLICSNPERCMAVKNDIIIFRVHHHLTATFARSLAPALDRALL
jgi:peptidoglycan/LPS O-acetylase OafA/YrhL